MRGKESDVHKYFIYAKGYVMYLRALRKALSLFLMLVPLQQQLCPPSLWGIPSSHSNAP